MKKLLVSALLLMCSSLSATQVLVFAGSLRSDSYNKLLAKEAAELARQEGANVTYIDLRDFPMPFYDADLETSEGLPKNAKKLRDLMMESDAVIIASPQYNESVSSVLKNAIDWASRGEDGQASKAAFKGKKFALMSASPRKKGGAKGLSHLRVILGDCGADVIEPETSVRFADQAFDSQGHLIDTETLTLLRQQIQALLPSLQ